ncbi:hypothetical protein SESBI_39192 [Sesbania bispinosa]|nr:hypothetical protein SESBI_39192 [Sesbania bispinosa]
MELCLHYLFRVFRSSDKIAVSFPNSEVNVIHTLCSTAKAVINRIETKMHKHSKSVVLALVLIGYKCIREASTEAYLSEAIDMVSCTSPLLKRIIDDEAELDDSILPLGEMFETCLSVIAALTKDCIEEFHLQEVKKSSQRKLINAKLAFSLEQIILIAKLALESKCVENSKASESIHNTITRESVNIASECLSLMVLLQTLSKDNDCQRSFMNLLLEAIVMLFLSTGDGFSQEVSDLRSTAIKLVSHFAQIPSSAVHFKDVLLSMPPLHRQQLQASLQKDHVRATEAVYQTEDRK